MIEAKLISELLPCDFLLTVMIQISIKGGEKILSKDYDQGTFKAIGDEIAAERVGIPIVNMYRDSLFL